MKDLGMLIDDLERKIVKQEVINKAISSSPVGWHIEHTLLTINLIIDQLKKSDPNDYKWSFSFTRMLVFTMNRIPRGRVQSPRSVRPRTDFTVESLTEHAGITKEKIKELQTLAPNNYFKHPFFGKLRLKPTIKFLGIHTKHHIDIMNDIIGSSQH